MLGDYTTVGSGPIMFFFLMAILSVPLAATTISYCIRGMILADKTRKPTYKTLLITTIAMNAIFIPAVISYKWLDINSAYQSMYHMVGYFGNIILVSIAGVYASKDKVSSPAIFFLSSGVSIIYLVIAAAVCSALSISTQYASSSSVGTNAASLIIGTGYALIQLVIPLAVWAIVSKNRDQLMQKIALKKATVPVIPVAQPVATQPTTAPQTPPLTDQTTPTEASTPFDHEDTANRV